MMRWRVGLLLGGMVLWVSAAAMGQAPVNRVHTETSLGPFPPEAYESARVSPDGRRLAYVATAEVKQAVVLDGQRQAAYDRVDALEFSPDSRRVAYAAQRGEAWVVVVDGQEQGPYRRTGPPVFSPDSRHVAYVVLLEDDRRAVVLDGQAGTAEDLIFEGRIVFSPDSRRVTYGAQRGNEWFVVAAAVPSADAASVAAADSNARPIGPYEFLGSETAIQYSADGGRLAFAALQGGKWAVVVNGQPGALFDNVGELAFSPDGKRLAYAAHSAGKWQVVVDGKPQKAYGAIAAGSITFSPDGARLAYAAEAAGKWLVVADGREGKAYDDVGEIKFSGDGRSLAYVVKSAGSELVVLDGEEGRPFDRIGGGTLEFSPGGKLAYVANTGDVSFAVVDGNRKPRYDLVGYLTFTPDGAHAVYIAVRGEEAFSVVDDQEAAHRYEGVWNVRGKKLIFDTRRRFHYLAVRQGNMLLVEEEIGR